ncbi:MAG TPA: hypothetical protein DCP38_11550 [Acidobacteria bacterium]|nr:hypothetical protein [Acidobacteriota bacterium]|tara:strand:+ start:2770 stop:5319 length:2550 start_codon:yes stop_codon:yes gene_type:complete
MRTVRRLWYVFRRAREARELEAELKFHLEMKQQELESDGLDRREAAVAARRTVGNTLLTRDRARDVWIWPWLHDAVQDVRYALRMLGRNPGFASIAILTLAVGIGANTAIFSVVNAVLLRPLAYRASEELVRIHTRFLPESGRDVPKFGIAPAEVLDYRDASNAMADVGYYAVNGVTLLGSGDLPARVRALQADDRLLPLLGVEPAIGRWFGPEEDESGVSWTVLLGHALWRTRFGADSAVLGRTISLSGAEAEIIGVMPQDFKVPGEDVDLFAPLRYPEHSREERDSHNLSAIGRLGPGHTPESARLESEGIQTGWAEQYGHPGPGHVLVFAPLQDDVVGSAGAALWILFAAVALVLVIAAANVGNLLLARGESRMAEMSIRAALGASRSRVLRQMLTGSIVLAILGTAIGVGIAAWGVGVARAMDPSTLPRASSIALDLPVLVFTAGMALLAAEVALCVVVLVGAGLLVRSFVALVGVDTGLETEGRLSFELAVPASLYENGQNAPAIISRIRERLLALPGVTGGSYTSLLPFSGIRGRRGFTLENRLEPAQGDTAWNAETASVRSGWFQTLGIPLVKGRAFRESDGAETELVAVISEEMERLFWPEEDPIGKRLGFEWWASARGESIAWVTVVGVVGNTRTQRLDGGFQPEMYLHHDQAYRVHGDPGRNGSFVLQTIGDPLALMSAVRREVADVEPRLAVADVSTLRARIDGSVSQPRLAATLMGGFAAIALFLATVGIYGVVSHSTVRRTREIGIRRVLGADGRSVVGMMVREAAAPAVVGLAVGLFATFALVSLLETLLFQISPRDPGTFAAIAAMVAAVTLVAAWLPARRAARVPPAIAIRLG